MSQTINEFILSRTQSKDLDNKAVTINKIPPKLLMEEAAEKIYSRLFIDFKNLKNKKIAIICGWGNNGGDSLSLARKLHFKGIKSNIFIFKDRKGSELYELHKSILESLNIILFDIKELFLKHNQFDIIIDSIFGIGYNYRKDETIINLFNQINNTNSKIISIDTPSGLDNNNNESIIADYTYSIGFLKKYFFTIFNRKKIGKIINLTISFDIKNLNIDQNNKYLSYIYPIKKNKNNFVHKYSRGSCISIGGETGKFGSILFTAETALSVGAGISLIITEDQNVVSINMMSKKVIVDNFQNLFKYINKYNVVIIGPGLGFQKESNKKVILEIIKLDKQFILDASFFTLFNKDILNNFKNPPILTPHSNEFKSFFKNESYELDNNTIDVVSKIAKKYNSYIILKESFLTIADPNGKILIYDKPMRILAQAGSGDILSGILGGFISQNYSIKKSILESLRLFYKTAKKLKKSNSFSYSPDKFIKHLESNNN